MQVSGTAGFTRKQTRLARAVREKHQLITKTVNYSQGILKGKYHCTIDLLFVWN